MPVIDAVILLTKVTKVFAALIVVFLVSAILEAAIVNGQNPT